jgi:hypothetical protein
MERIWIKIRNIDVSKRASSGRLNDKNLLTLFACIFLDKKPKLKQKWPNVHRFELPIRWRENNNNKVH